MCGSHSTLAAFFGSGSNQSIAVIHCNPSKRISHESFNQRHVSSNLSAAISSHGSTASKITANKSALYGRLEFGNKIGATHCRYLSCLRRQRLLIVDLPRPEPSPGLRGTRRMRTPRVKSRRTQTYQQRLSSPAFCPLFSTAHSDSACLGVFSPRLVVISANCSRCGIETMELRGSTKPSSLINDLPLLA